LAISCGDQAVQEQTTDAPDAANTQKLFSLVPTSQSNLEFTNDIFEDARHNIFAYDYMYTGGGVAVGDVNGDDLLDIYFGGNMVPDKLYLNKGGMVFEDATAKAGLDSIDGWTMGTLIADLTGDGLNDIYVCRSYWVQEPGKRTNLLYKNNGDGTFTESAAEYGLADQGFTIHASLIDYDLDGDLDIYLTNHPVDFDLGTHGRLLSASRPDENVRDKLYRNDNYQYTDVSQQAGIYNYGYGLGAAIGDLNEDGWPDIYVANDYEEPDFFYRNNGDGTFTEALQEHFAHVSYFGMGSDIADINNDGHLDLAVMDMAAEDNYRSKTMMASMNIPRFWELVSAGRHYQYMRNTLQLNNGNGSFSEIGQYSGIHKTDWSWSILFADMDNDGWKDGFVSNGYRRDSRNVDAVNHLFELFKDNPDGYVDGDDQFQYYLSLYPSKRMNNHFLQNNGDLTFSKRSFEVGMNVPSFSNGAAYGDMDNDGDLDLVINNLVDPAFLYENHASQIAANNYLRIRFNGPKDNPLGLGTKVEALTADYHQVQELQLSRGYISCVEPVLHFGLGGATDMPTLKVTWPDGSYKEFRPEGEVNQLITIDYQKGGQAPATQVEPLFVEIEDGIDFTHKENEFDDFKKEILLPYETSHFGPALAQGDLNGDGLDDLFIGGAKGQAGETFLQSSNGKFISEQKLTGESGSEDVGAVFFDADGDGDLDLYVVSGGNAFAEDDDALQDRLYLNAGGKLELATERLPEMLTSGSSATAGDYDGDGDLDLFVGGLLIPGKYPFPARSYVLQNNDGRFTDVTADVLPDLESPGMVTDAAWFDHDKDGDLDLTLVGHWMPITVLTNDGGVFSNSTEAFGLGKSVGWWNTVTVTDFDRDGDLDLLAGNFGENSKFHPSEDEPLHIYCHDFDNTGTYDIVLGYYNQGVCYPVRGRQCSSEQMPNIKDKFPTYHDYGSASLEDVYGEGLNEALHYEATNFASCWVEHTDGEWLVHKLPAEVQMSTVFGMAQHRSIGWEGAQTVVVAGNFYPVEIETGRNDASPGYVMTMEQTGEVELEDYTSCGLNLRGDVRRIALVESNEHTLLIVLENNGPARILRSAWPNRKISMK
jgi:hypothetical protein